MSETLNEDLKKPEGSAEILGGRTEERKDGKPRRKEISDEEADSATGGTSRFYGKSSGRKFNFKRKRKRDDILLPEI